MEDNPHIQELLTVRNLLVEKRREHAKAAKGNIDGWIPGLTKYHDAIEMIDRAISDEKKLATPSFNILENL